MTTAQRVSHPARATACIARRSRHLGGPSLVLVDGGGGDGGMRRAILFARTSACGAASAMRRAAGAANTTRSRATRALGRATTSASRRPSSDGGVLAARSDDRGDDALATNAAKEPGWRSDRLSSSSASSATHRTVTLLSPNETPDATSNTARTRVRARATFAGWCARPTAREFAIGRLSDDKDLGVSVLTERTADVSHSSREKCNGWRAPESLLP